MKKKYLAFLALLAAILILPGCGASTPEEKQAGVLRDIMRESSSVSSFRATLEFLAAGEETPMQYALWLSKPNSFRLEGRSPDAGQVIIVSDGAVMQTYIESQNTLTLENRIAGASLMDNLFAADMPGFLANIEQLYKVEDKGVIDSLHVLSIIPQDNPDAVPIILSFDPANWRLVKLEAQDYTAFYSYHEFNVPTDGFFEIEHPEDTLVIDLRT